MKISHGDFVGWNVRGTTAIGQVLSVHTDGLVQRPVPVQASPDQPIAQIRVFRDGTASDALVAVPVADLRKVDFVQSPSGSDMGTPNERQMGLINQYLPKGARRLQPSEVVTVSFVAADNILNRGLMRWDIPSLQEMAKRIVDKPAMLDHAWEEVSKVWGRVYDAQLVKKRPTNEALDQAGNFEQNQAIVQAEGYYQVVFDVFATVDSPVVAGLMAGRLSEISIGGFRFKDLRCPICNRSFFDEDEPHGIPMPEYGLTGEGYAPYSIRSGLYDMGEVSVVTIPNLPTAGVIR